jgi:hypothetical protein
VLSGVRRRSHGLPSSWYGQGIGCRSSVRRNLGTVVSLFVMAAACLVVGV